MDRELPPMDTDLRQRLHDDAQRIVMPPFDPRLHHAVLARIQPRFSLRPVVGPWALGTAVAAAAAVVVLLLSPVQQPPTPAPQIPSFALTHDLPPGSYLAYTRGLADGEESLIAMLDRDGSRPLLRSAPVNPDEDLP